MQYGGGDWESKVSYRNWQRPEREGARIPDHGIRTQHETLESQSQS